jgi:hypothetical protein
MSKMMNLSSQIFLSLGFVCIFLNDITVSAADAKKKDLPKEQQQKKANDSNEFEGQNLHWTVKKIRKKIILWIFQG